MKRYLKIVALSMLAIAGVFQMNAQALRGQENDYNTVNLNAAKLAQTYLILNGYYIDTLNFPAITDKLMAALVRELDPHSDYIPEKDVKAMNEPIVGNFSGVGVEFAILGDTLTVQATIQGGPAESVGVKAGDKIVGVDGERISNTGLTIERIHKYLRGPEGSLVEIEVERRGEPTTLHFVIRRGKIPVNSIDASYECADGVLYIKLSRFSQTSYREFMTAVQHYPHHNGILLDLRNNGGGMLVSALQIANEFLKRGELILYTEGRTVRQEVQRANGYGSLQNIPLAIIVNENSASASEIVSGAIQDWDRGVIIGRRTFGKGLVQQQIPLKDGSMLRVTVSRYHTPSGRVIQRPYKKGDSKQYYKDFAQRYSNGGGVYGADTIQFPDSLKYTTLVKGRTVYGGGGIMPDIFIPSDTTFYTPFYGDIARKGILSDFVNNYVDHNRESLKKRFAGNYEAFVKEFSVEGQLFDDFLSYAKIKGVVPKEGDLNRSREELRFYLKGLVLRGITDMDTYFRYINSRDIEVARALEELAKLRRSPEAPL